MNEIVRMENDEVFTDSLVIAEGTDNANESIIKLINKYEKEFNTLGKIEFSDYLKSKRLKTTGKICFLNEQQATFLMTLLRNNETVVNFKLKLTQEFYRMRTALMERQTTEWQKTRIAGKFTRRKETDALALLKIYAEEQREGKPYNHIYVNYTKLVNDAVGLKAGERETASFKQLQIVSMLEDMIESTVEEEMQKNVFFKDIYQTCKNKVETISSLLYINKTMQIGA